MVLVDTFNKNLYKMDSLLGGVSPYFQLQFNTKKEPIAAEILMRSHEGEITDIVRNLEEKNEIHLLDFMAFQNAIKWYKRNELPCASNFSGKTLTRDRVASDISISACMLPIKIELTETSDLDQLAIANLKRLNFNGFTISLDDFGSKYNGMNRLLQAPFRELKIDKFLVDRLDDSRAREIVRSTINLGNKINCQVVAEGVETTEQFDLLLELGCDRFQGYLLHEPEAFVV